MEAKHLSTTLLTGWAGENGCPSRAWDSYSERMEFGETVDTDATLFGTVVHSVVEEIFNAEVRGVDLDYDPVSLFVRRWEGRYGTSFEYFSTGYEGIGPFLDRCLADRGDTIATELTFLLDLATGEVLVDDAITEEAAANMVVPVRSTIDRVDRVGKNTFRVVDYKTNRLPFTRQQVEESIQLTIYDIAVRAIWPEAEEVICVYDMFRHGRFVTTFEESDRLRFIAWATTIWNQINMAEVPPEKLNSFCPYCSRRAHCETYLAVVEHGWIEGFLPSEGEQDGKDVSWYVEKYEQLKVLEKLARDAAEKLSGAVSAQIAKIGGLPLSLGDGREVFLQPNPRYEYPTVAVFDVLQKKRNLSILKEVATISRPKLDRAISDRPALEKAIKPLLRIHYVKPSLKTRNEEDG